MRRVRVLHVLSLNVVGGVERLFDAWLSHSAAAGFEHHVLSMRREIHPRFAPALREHAASVARATHWAGVRLPKWPAFLRARHLDRALAAAKPEVALLWNTLGDAEVFAALRRNGAARCYYEHGAAALRAANDPGAAELPRMDGILCVCRASKRLMELRYGVKPEDVRVAINPVIGAAVTARVEVEPPSAGRPLRLGFAGRITPLKGLPLVLHAARRILDAGTACELRIAGAGADLAAMQRLAVTLGLDGKAVFLGPVQDMPAFYRDIDILIAPSLRETMPLVCMEAAWAGRPVIAAAINGVPEVVLDGETGFTLAPRLPLTAYAGFGGTSLNGVASEYYDPSSDTMKPAGVVDPGDLAERALRLYRDPDEYVRMANAASTRAREIFGMDRCAATICQAISELGNAASSRRE